MKRRDTMKRKNTHFLYRPVAIIVWARR